MVIILSVYYICLHAVTAELQMEVFTEFELQ